MDKQKIENESQQKPKIKLVGVHGVPGVGKSTTIEQLVSKDFIKIEENIPEILPYLDKYYQAIWKACQGETCSQSEQKLFIIVQLLVMTNRAERYLKIDPNQKYIFERTMQEDIFVFCETLFEFMNEHNQNLLKTFINKFIEYEPKFDDNIYKKEDETVITERIIARGRQGEKIHPFYIHKLQERSLKFIHKKQFQKYNTPLTQDSMYLFMWSYAESNERELMGRIANVFEQRL